MKLRAAAANCIYQVIVEGQGLTDVLSKMLPLFSEKRDQAFIQAISFGVCRRYYYLDALAQMLLNKPMNEKDQDIYCIILIGLYQLTDMRVPPHAAIAETVEVASYIEKPWAKNLVNAILRGYQRQADELNNKISQGPEAHYNHPAWMIGKVKKQWPNDWETILAANNQQPPLALRVNLQRLTREKYLQNFSTHESKASPIAETNAGIIIEPAVDVSNIPGFAAGEISVQDGAAQLAAGLLQLEPGLRVLDACAAPGGKTAHILENQPDITLIAIDKDAFRLRSIQENLDRLQLSAICQCADAANIDQWWDGILFDRILLDAPCSASGVIRRHPDIKLLRRAEDIQSLSEQQHRLLNAMWKILKPNGLLVYATCSVFLEENVKVLNEFLAKNDDAKEEKINATWGIALEVGKQILPGMHQMDGFYYGCLRKKY